MRNQGIVIMQSLMDTQSADCRHTLNYNFNNNMY